MPKTKRLGKVHKSQKQPSKAKAPDKKLSSVIEGLVLEAARLLPESSSQKDRYRILAACVKLHEAAHLLNECHMQAPDRPECPECCRPVEKEDPSWETAEGVFHRWCTDVGADIGTDGESEARDSATE